MRLSSFLAVVSVLLAAAVPCLARQQPPLHVAVTAARHAFVYVADKPVKSVSVAGTFNNWDRAANPMKADADGKTWRADIAVPFGKHRYKFVLDGATWVTEPGKPTENDGNGNVNSVLVVLPPDYVRPARPDDGITAASALLHETRVPYRNWDRGVLTLSLRARPGDLRSVAVFVNNKRVPMVAAPPGTDGDLYTRYVARLPWDRRTDLSYVFALTDGTRMETFGANGLVPKAQPFVLRATEFKPFVVPAWVENAVIYQIFPDRFANGDTSNDPPDVTPWDGAPTYYNRMGGDIAGVRAHLGYLADLGVDTVYFNPVFASPSNHRYDTSDYKTIDPQFGTNAEWNDLTREMKRRGLRTVMDFVFNHTSPRFAPFADIREKNEASAYKDWYFIHSYPVHGGPTPNYAAWSGHESMPKLNVMNPPTRDYLLGLVDFWDTNGALGGMRLDVAGEVDPRFWRALRTHAKTRDPDIWIVGEFWGDATPWLGGDQWDSVMDYPFRDACLQFFANRKTTPTQFTSALMGIYSRYAPQVSRNLMNLLSSHDTPRFLTECKNDADLARLAAVVQFTWAGTPSIYYGEEIGMEGGRDPDNRRGMRWDLAATPDNPMLAFYKRLIAARREHPALRQGDPVVQFTNDADGTLAYARVLGDTDAALIAVNRSDAPRRVPLVLPPALRRPGVTLVDALTGHTLWKTGNRPDFADKMTITLTLPARSAVVLVRGR